MAVRTFPVSLANFFTALGKAAATMDLRESLAVGDTHGGATFPIDFGPRLWSGSVSTRLYKHADVAEAAGLMDLLRRGGSTFYVTGAVNAAPKADPTGSILGAATVTITAKPSNQELTLGGLPASYVLTRGDMLSFSYNSATQFALHRVVDTVTASGGGVVTIQVEPSVRGTPTGATVTLISPKCLAILVPGSYTPPSGNPDAHSGFSFDWIQVKP